MIISDMSEVPTVDVLAIAAHPDDVEQTCGGTMIRMAEQGYKTGVLDLTAGDMGSRGTPELRLEESAAAEISPVRGLEVIESRRIADTKVVFLRKEPQL